MLGRRAGILAPLGMVLAIPSLAGLTTIVAGVKEHGETAQQQRVEAVVERSLVFLQGLASAQLLRTDVAETLLSTTPQEAVPVLNRLDINVFGYMESLEALRVEPVFIFGSLETGIEELAARFDHTLQLRVPYAPPIELRGPHLKTLLLFEPILPTDDPELPQIIVAYDVNPSHWNPNLAVSHEVCVDDKQSQVPLSLLVTHLTYGDGTSDSTSAEIRSMHREACSVTGHESSTAIRMRQLTRASADRPIVIASAYVLNRQQLPSNVIGIPLSVTNQ